MSVHPILDSLLSAFLPAGLVSANEPAKNPNVLEPEPQPLCASAIGGERPHPLLGQLTSSARAWQKGLNLFRSEAIPMADVNVSKTSIYFSDTKVGSSSSDSFYINNPSDCPLRYTVGSPPSGFSLSTSGGTIPARSSVSVSVTFSPSYEQDYSGYINITPGSSSVYVKGKGKKNN